MNALELSNVIRQMAKKLDNMESPDRPHADAAELLNVLARVVEGKPIEKSFGAPGDWGYGTPIGEALRQPGGVGGAAPVRLTGFDADHVGEILGDQANEYSNFGAYVLRLVKRADAEQRRVLARIYPEHVAAVEDWEAQ